MPVYINEMIPVWIERYKPVTAVSQTRAITGDVISGWRLTFNEFSLSIQWGYGNYGDNYEALLLSPTDPFNIKIKAGKIETAELAIVDDNGIVSYERALQLGLLIPDVILPDDSLSDDVYSYMTASQVEGFLALLAPQQPFSINISFP